MELAAKLRRTARMRLVSVRETTGRAFIDRLGRQTCIHLVAATSAQGHWLLEIEPAILYPMIDCLLGGGRENSPPVRRPPTEIERRLAARLVELLVRELEAAWQASAIVTLSLDHPARDPAAVPAADSPKPFVWSSFEVNVGAAQGAIHLAMPLAAAVQMLTGTQMSSNGSGRDRETAGETIELVACLPDLEITDDEAAELAVGDLIETDHSAAAPIQIIHSGMAKFQAHSAAWPATRRWKSKRSSPQTRTPDRNVTPASEKIWPRSTPRPQRERARGPIFHPSPSRNTGALLTCPMARTAHA